jgi:hypothetical protein
MDKIEITTKESVEVKALVDKFNALVERANVVLSQIQNAPTN